MASDLNGNESVAGLPATLILPSRAALAYPAGWVLDRIGPALIFTAWAVYLGSFSGFLIGFAFFGGSRAAVEPSLYIVAEIFPLSQKAKAIGAIRAPLLVQPSTSLSDNLGLGAVSGPYIAGGFLRMMAASVLLFWFDPICSRLATRSMPS